MTETRWLSDQEQQSWRAFIDGCRALFDVLDRQLQAESNLPHAYFEILIPLSEEPGRALRMSELAERARSSRSRLSHAVARLEERGWVRRTDCPTDKRGQLAELTDEGFAVVQAAAPGHVEAVRTYLIDQLSPEQIRVLGEVGDIMLRTTAETDLPPRRN
ncbi:MarR family winged helix-turn-helix transcriptional regulator [Jatrophihabitans lederbergiae]|uniref:MarR family transcriptional regulator n=1 Tax=Jatrophihabitans lederbergiae TaxID=3075547 RepID=A0ABU2JD45_9ACTN|nr:MarR family transcriptional regulator [Jatrophihabitans sp. DSM 44399]MDT0262900.1 MarR family transcriptional regulator [Jatrophihabitans sp. DSM 44399]